ncbi:MAG: acetolactate synthase small subunit [Clostridiales bacterium]|jgi:acetolactate synthase-1/3 small subunit|nr:acetolactate synthase small subunit [Clostridiales bacterium]
MEKFTIELIVANRYGVLNRITGLYARRGYNIDSLNVNETADPQFSRMLIVSRGDAYIQTQMVRQLSKLYDVKEVTLMATVNFKK